MTQPNFGSNDSASDPTNFCYRHPDRQSFILCQRCGRTICPECQTQAAVGFHCPECVREARATAPRVKPRLVTSARRMGKDGSPVVTYSLIGLTVAIFVLQFVLGDIVTGALLYRPLLTAVEPWTMITSIFVHQPGSLFHVGLNMLSLFIFGRILEPAIGRWRFLALYLISGFGGSVAVLLLDPFGGVYGASGAIYGMLGAFFIIQRRLGGNSLQIVILIGLNLVIGFFVPNISWQAHVGGLVTGALVALILMSTRNSRARPVQISLLAGLVAVLVAISIVRITVPF